jgi:phosphoglycerate dehydrogenase-like enzyme
VQVLYHHPAGGRLRARFDALAEAGFSVQVVEDAQGPALDRALETADVLWHCLYPVDQAFLDRAPRLRLIQKIGVGVNTIERAGAAARGIAVCNLPGSNAPAVAEHTLALMLATLRQLPRLDAAMRIGQGWALTPTLEDGLGELGGRRVGLVGWGATAQRLAPVLAALGATVQFCARTTHDAPYPQRPFEALLEESDVVSLHLPLTAMTQNMMNAGAFARLPAGAILINTARGALVEEAALLAALASGRLAGAGLDVFDTEPLAPDHPLLAFPQVVLSPHSAWLTQETLARSLETAVENLHRLRRGAPLLHQVPAP